MTTAPTKPKNLQANIEAIKAIVGPERVSVAEADLTQHARDQSDHPACPPDIVVWPKTTQEVSNIVSLANNIGLPVVAWGAGTSIEGNPIPVQGGIVLNFREMNQILKVHQNDFQVTVQPGLLYKDMNKALARYGLFFAPDPGANASIGGMIANNAAGIRTVKYGATKDNVLALEVVKADGQVIRTGSRSVKQSAGYDLTRLFVGSEGTLGIVTEATLKLEPLPEHFSAVTAAFPSVKDAAEAVYSIIGAGLGPAALELLDTNTASALNTEEGINLLDSPNLFMEFNGASESALIEELKMVEEICNECNCQKFQAGVGREARNRLWQARHSAFEVMLRHHPGEAYLLTDASVPISQYPALVAAADEIMEELDLRGYILGHAGDGNLHTALFFAANDPEARDRAERINGHIVKHALELSGTSTGEHGVGLGKKKYMEQEHGPVAMQLMQDIKTVLDPNGILNPGKVLGV